MGIVRDDVQKSCCLLVREFCVCYVFLDQSDHLLKFVQFRLFKSFVVEGVAFDKVVFEDICCSYSELSSFSRIDAVPYSYNNI